MNAKTEYCYRMTSRDMGSSWCIHGARMYDGD